MALRQQPVQVGPARIAFENEPNFPRPWPMLHRLLALDGAKNRLVRLAIDKPIQPVCLGEPVDDSFPMLPNPARYVRGDADIERAVRAVGHDVDPRGPHGGCITAWMAGSSPRLSGLYYQ